MDDLEFTFRNKYLHVNIIMLHGDIHKSGVKATLAKIFIWKILCLKVENTLI